MNKFSEVVGKSLGRHFVSLSCVQHPPAQQNSPAQQKVQVHVFSGFIIDVAGYWFYVTAGHILRDIRTAISSGSTFDIWRLGDQTAGNKFNDTAVPYGFDNDDWFVLEDESIGLDYAIVPIVWPYRQQLEAGGVLALDKSAWSDHVADHDHWALVGIPKETVAYDGKTIISARFVMAPLHRIEEVPPLAKRRAENQFYAKLAEDTEAMLSDVVGMSGGPVFQLKELEGTLKYGVIGVQSAWYPTSRVVAICPFSSFALALESVLKEELVALSTVKETTHQNEIYQSNSG